MKKETKLVFDYLRLKPEVKALGFNKEELEGIAADLADKLTLEENASDEEVQGKVAELADASIPYLSLAQKTATRIVNKRKEKDEPVVKIVPTDNESAEEKIPNKEKEVVPEWAKALIDANKELKAQIAEFKGEQTTKKRREELSSLLNGSGKFGERILKSFDKMGFNSDDDYESFKSEIIEDLASYNQERADAGLEKIGVPGTSGIKNGEEKVKPYSEEEIKELAENL